MKIHNYFSAAICPNTIARRLRTACAVTLLPLLLLSALAVKAGQFGDYTYTSNGTNITITGYSGTNLAVTIPGTIAGLPVTSIGYEAFWKCTNLTSVVIGTNVTSVRAWAFVSCASLTNVTVGNSVTSIGHDAFFNCANLAAVTVDVLNSTYSSVNGVLFDKTQTTLIYCPVGTTGSYTVPDSVTSIGDWAFYNCISLTNIMISNSVTSIGNYAFYDCSSLTNVIIGNSVTNIGVGALFNCADLTSVIIPNSVTSIGDSVFLWCTKLTAITVDALNPVYSSVNGVLFDKSQTTLIYCPEGKTGSYTIPNSVTNIGEAAFHGCISLTEVTISNSITSIGYWAFEDCISLTNVIIGKSATNIPYSAFDECINLTSFTVDALNSVYSSLDGVLFNENQTTLIKCPVGKTSCQVPGSVTSIGDYAFGNCYSLPEVYFKGNAPSISSKLFYGPNGETIYVTIYYLPGTTGWGTTFGGSPTVLWNPQAQTSDASFGVRTNRFGFNITAVTGTNALSFVVEACTNLSCPVWQPLLTNTGSAYFSDPDWTNYPGRFYRIRSP